MLERLHPLNQSTMTVDGATITNNTEAWYNLAGTLNISNSTGTGNGRPPFFNSQSATTNIRNNTQITANGGDPNVPVVLAQGTFDIADSTIQTDTGIALQVAGGTFVIQGTTITGNVTHSAGAATANGTVTVNGSYTESGGSLTLNAGSTLSLTQTLWENGGLITINNATLSATGGIQIALSAIFIASGQITGSVTNAGQFYVGNDGVIASLTVTGSFTQTSTGFLWMDVSGSSTEDHLSISALASLAGTLKVSGNADVGGFFDLIDWGSLSGTFDTVSTPPGTWSYSYGTEIPGHFTLTRSG